MRFERSPLSCTRALAIAALILVGTAAVAQAPLKVGELEPAALATAHPYPAGVGGNAQQWIVSYPDATYIRVHFSRFDLAPGDYVEISDPSGLAVHTFDGRGPHGNGQFWASTIAGETAVITLQAASGGGFGFEIDSFGRGTQSVFGADDPGLPAPDPGLPGGDPAPDSVCGVNNWRDVECYNGSQHDAQYQKSAAAVKLLIGCCSACTGFKVSDSGQFMTNNHCTSSQSGVQSTELLMNYKLSGCGSGSSGNTGSVFGQDLVATAYTLDYTLMTTTGNSDALPCLTLAPRQANNGDQIFIAHHPSGGVKKMSIDSDLNSGNVCRVDNNAVYGRGPASDIGYYCDTTNGSSGSPVLDYNTLEVIALHHFGGCLNSGGRSDLILGEIGGLIDTCSGGGGATCGDGTCDPGETQCGCPDDCGLPPLSEVGSCDDGVDNDCDGQTDCNDTLDCSTDPVCDVPPPPTCALAGDSCGSHGDCCPGLRCKGSKNGKFCSN